MFSLLMQKTDYSKTGHEKNKNYTIFATLNSVYSGEIFNGLYVAFPSIVTAGRNIGSAESWRGETIATSFPFQT